MEDLISEREGEDWALNLDWLPDFGSADEPDYVAV